MAGVDSGSLQADSQPKSFGLDWGRRPLSAILPSSNEPGELSQWLCHDDSTINNSMRYYYYYYYYYYYLTFFNLPRPAATATAATTATA